MGLTLMEVNRSTSLHHKIIQVWGEIPEEREQGGPGEQRGGVSEKTESHGLQKKDDEHRSDTQSQRIGDINGSKASSALPRYGVAFGCKIPI